MKNSGLELNPDLVFRGDFNLKTGYHAARKFAMQSNMPTAIVAENDILAIGSIKYFLQSKIRVPEDVAVIGFDNIMLSAMYEPSLSTISLPIDKMGEESVKLLMAGINKAYTKSKQVILNNNLIIRNSTDSNVSVEFDL
jgi:LacI family transcriptional regulator, repressor for deo operon, udp, cdd, tsx, nupC, and nupG